MAALPPEVLKAIDGPVRQIRKALAELEPQELPAALHKVTATAGGRLPPPLLARLLGELDGNEWLRGRIADKLGDRIEPDTDAFLARPPGWWLTTATNAAQAARHRPPLPEGDEVAAVRRKLAVARQRIEEAESQRDSLRAEMKAAKAALARLVDPEQSTERLAGLQAEIDRLEDALAVERAARTESEERVADLMRRQRPAEVALRTHPAPRAVGLTDPVETARRLDLLIASYAAGLVHPKDDRPQPSPESPSAPRPVMRLAPGLAPDRPEAVAWLLGTPDPVLVVVDGYNVTYKLDPVEFTAGPARRRLVGSLSKLGSRKPHRIMVVFDSAQPESEPARFGDVEVRFTTGEKADDLIVAIAAATRHLPVVVVTNDRELRERVEAEEALALWAEALVPHLG
ncbi:MAG: NYN domain-containing protein [Actinomycetota bacterium]|nr:NYN domain-containing protein [Actinomycetota bacterium]